jgi:para-nitrobenzyl esterase
VPPRLVLEAQQRVEAGRAAFMSPVVEPFYPCVDGEHLAARPIDAIAEGAGSDITMLTGTNADEMTLFGLGQVDDDHLSRTLGRYAQPVDELLDVYRAELPDATAGELATAFTTDYVFRIPAIRMAEARAEHDATTWMYEFDWKSRAFGGALGATHALEIPFAFDTLDAPGVDVFTGVSEPPRELGAAMHAAWTMFIRDGVVDWPAYDGIDRAVMRFADDLGVVHDPSPATRKVWSGVR